MEFRIADTFTDSLARLTGDEQKAVKTSAFDLQVNPTATGMNLHRIEKSKDKNFWSARASSDIRIIVHKTPGSLLLCYVDHHDKAYDLPADGFGEGAPVVFHRKNFAFHGRVNQRFSCNIFTSHGDNNHAFDKTKRHV